MTTDKQLKLLRKITDRYKMLDGQFCHCGLPAYKKIGNDYLCYRHNSPPSSKGGGSRGRFSGKSQTPYGVYESK